MAISSSNSSLMLQNRTLSTSIFRLPKLGFVKPIGYLFKHSISSSYSKNPIPTLSCLVKATVSDVDQLQSSKPSTHTLSTDSWQEFARNISGEWDGFGADFTSEGQPVELPEIVVPEAYRDWEVKVFDWQTQCPTLAQLEETAMIYKTIKLLPTVGCEADAATRESIDERKIGGHDNQVSSFAYQSSGCYVAVWPMKDCGSYRLLELEHCLVNPLDRESRVRIIQVIKVDDGKMVLVSIKVFRELWYGPYRNGEQLGGCAVRSSGFASTAPTKASEVLGAWYGPSSVARLDGSQSKIIQAVTDESPLKSVRDETNLILLPQQLWCSLKEIKNGGTISEVGWLVEHGRAVTSRCILSNDVKLKEISISQETAASENVEPHP